ncbi:MAG: hypothetical protein ACRBDX_00345 [Gammaproteobacteria bacterium]
MNAKKFIIACIAVIIFIMAFDFLYHGMFMASTYEQTADLWRPHEVMNDYMIWMSLGQIIMSVGFVALFTKAFKRGGIAEGAIYGLLVAILFIGTNLIMYAVAPYPISMVINWIIGVTIQLVLAGIIVAFIFRNKSTT